MYSCTLGCIETEMDTCLDSGRGRKTERFHNFRNGYTYGVPIHEIYRIGYEYEYMTLKKYPCYLGCTSTVSF